MSEVKEAKPKTPGLDHPITIERNNNRVVVKVAGRIIADTRVPVFIKQLGSVAYDAYQPLPTQHYPGGDPDEWPVDLRVREYPV